MDFVDDFGFAPARSDSLFVPSTRCQSLLGKAIQEHFTKPEQVASLFSSSPSLQNSSAGANFLTNFKLDWQTLTIFETVFTPEDCFSVQLSPCLDVFAKQDDDWEIIFSFIKNLISNTRYVEASLRSLKIASFFINDEQLQFIFSHLKRITKLQLNLQNNLITSFSALDTIGENLLDLEQLRVFSSHRVNHSVLQLFAANLTKLEKLELEHCSQVLDGSLLAITGMKSLKSLINFGVLGNFVIWV
jgi:hypothetical protein